MKGIKLQPREKMIVTLAVLAVIGYAFYAFWFAPYNARIAEAKRQIEKLQAELQSTKALLSKEKDYQKRKAEIEALALNLQQQLPSIEAMPRAVADIKSIIESNGASIKSIVYDKGAQKKGLDPSLDYKAVKVAFSANYAQAFALVKNLETTSQRSFTISDLSLNKDKTGLNGTMTVEIYFAKTAIPGFEYKPLLETQGKADPFVQ